jgi:coproporphyrinogen III oxidase-like Fe-S oxidoreductase
LEHWKGQLDKIIGMRPDSIASLQLQITKTVEMMANRIKILKKENNG